MPHRVSPTDRVRGDIDELFASGRPLPEILEDVARLGSTHPASYGHALSPPARTTTPLRMSTPSPNITMNWNHVRPFYTGFRTLP